MSDKIYAGTGKLIEFQSGGTMIRLSFSREDLQRLNDNLDQDGWVRLNVKQRREPSKTGQTHYGEVDTWKPTPKEQPDGQQAEKSATKTQDQIPF